MTLKTPRFFRSIPAGIAIAMATVTLAVVGLDFLFSLMELLGKAQADEDIWGRLLADLPDRARRLLVECCLIGAVWHMGGLAQHGELGALRSLGVSSFRICLMAAVPAFLFAASVLVLAEYSTEQKDPVERRLQWDRQQGLVLLSQGCEGSLRWWRLEDGRVQSWGLAGAACYQDGHWRMRDASLWQAGREGAMRLDSWQMQASRPQAPTERANPRHMTMRELWQGRQSLADGRYRSALGLELWQRLTAPLKVAFLVLMATLLPLAMLRDSRTGMRLLVALGLAVGFHLVDTIIKTLGQNLALSSLLITAIPLLGLVFLYGFLLRRYS